MADPLVTDYRSILRDELAARSRRNPTYSLRAFSRDLDLAPSSLSEILNQRAGLSYEKAKQISTLLKLNPLDQQIFENSAGLFHSRTEQKRKEFWQLHRKLNLQKALEVGKKFGHELKNLCGIWKVTARLASEGGSPKEWEPLYESQHFVFNGDHFEFHQDRLGTGKSILHGTFEQEQKNFSTPNLLQSTSGRSPVMPKPWLAEFHTFTALNKDQFHLSTAPEDFQKSICPQNQSLETIWTKIKDI